MELTVLGSGTMTSPPRRNPAGYLIEAEGQFLIMDMGPGIIRQLKWIGVDLLKLNRILISHFHLDHCADLFPLLMNRFLLRGDSNNELTIFGPQGLRNWFEDQARWQGAWLHEALPQLAEWEGVDFEFEGWRVTGRLNLHTGNSLSFRIEKEKTLFYSGDTGYRENLIQFATGADLAVVECSLPDHLKQEGHLTPTETARFAREAGVKRLLVTHIYPQNDTPDLKEKIRAHFNGEVVIARDFLRIKI